MDKQEQIVWLASFPKSGNTWFRIFLANLTAGEAGPSDINDLDERGGIASSRREFEAVTMLESGLLSHDEVDRLRPLVYETIAADREAQRWIKVHDAYTLTSDAEPIFGRNIARAAVYLVRDPRDVAVSLAYHNNTTIDQAIQLLNAPNGALSFDRKGLGFQLRQKLTGWSGHVTSWLDQTDIPVHMIRFEDLVAAPAKGFAAALDFAGRTAEPAAIERAIRYSDFAELQRQEREKGFVERISNAAPFFRSGRTGGWREALTDDQVHAIEKCHHAVMARLGYVGAPAP